MAMAEQTSPLGERVSRIEGGYEHLATKADLAQMQAELKADIARVETELKADIGRLDGEVGDVRGEIGGLRGEINALRGEIRGIKWWLVSVGAAVVTLSSLAQLLPFGG